MGLLLFVGKIKKKFVVQAGWNLRFSLSTNVAAIIDYDISGLYYPTSQG